VQHEAVSADDGKQLHIRLSGSGTPILLLHGWTSCHAAWAALIKPLAGQHRLLRPVARGHGGHALSATRAPDVSPPGARRHQPARPL
jgi:pimeloyl-ACP methyl ester carboxylesterase